MSSLENNPAKYRLTEERHEHIFQTKIKPKLFSHIKSNSNPTAIIFGGQPGSGKSTCVDFAVTQLNSKGGCALIIGDEFRDYHPKYENLLVQDDKIAAFYTDQDTGRWIEKSIAYATKIKCNLVIEGTMRVPEKVAETMRSLREAGYQIEAHALAVNERLSWQGVLQRYENQRADRGFGRMTTPEAHQAGYVGMLNTLEYIEKEKLADKITIYKRGAEIIYQNILQNGQWQHEPAARTIVENERNRLWTLREKHEYTKNFDALVKLVCAPERKASQSEINTIISLQQKAKNIVLKYNPVKVDELIWMKCFLTSLNKEYADKILMPDEKFIDTLEDTRQKDSHPDFLLKTTNGRQIGIEFTQLVNRKIAKIESTKNNFISTLSYEHFCQNLPPARIEIRFKEGKIDEAEILKSTQAVINLINYMILNNLQFQSGFEIPDQLQKFFTQIFVIPNNNIYYYNSNGFQSISLISELKSSISRKNEKHSKLYSNAKLDEYWLVIQIDSNHPSSAEAPHDNGIDYSKLTKDSPFEKIFLYYTIGGLRLIKENIPTTAII